MIRKSVEDVSISSIQVLSWFHVKAENDLWITDTAEKEIIFRKLVSVFSYYSSYSWIKVDQWLLNPFSLGKVVFWQSKVLFVFNFY